MPIAAAVMIGLSALVASRAVSAAQDAEAPARVRIGTYDSRAIAVAHGRSASFLDQINDLRQQQERAKAAGDQKTADKLAAEGQSLQVRMHLQVFSNAPVDEILADVRDRLPGIAQQRNVLAIVPSTGYCAEDRVEVVDVTDDLAMLFNPDAKTRAIIVDLKTKSPLPIEKVAQMDPRKF